MIAFSCPHCGVQLQAKENMAGKSGPCPKCSRAVQTPPANTSSASGSDQKSGQRSNARAAKQQTLPPASSTSETDIPVLKLTPPKGYDFLAPPEELDELGRLGPYLIRKVLANGAMGIVFEAQDAQLKRLVALKVMKPDLAAQADFHRRFLREAQLAASIDHEHIVTIYQVGEDRGIPYLAMKLLQGESLEERLSRTGGRQPLETVLRIGREIAEGLAAAHAKGLVHRDIKPANIWLEEGRDRVKIVDFGLARGNGADAHFTQAGAVIGTPSYMAPEQANGEEVDTRCDLFSLGSVLYRISTGRLPFDGKDTLAVLNALATKTPVPPKKIAPDLPQAFSDLVMSLLAKDRKERPQAAREVVEAIEAIESDDLEEAEAEDVEEEALEEVAEVKPEPKKPAPRRTAVADKRETPAPAKKRPQAAKRKQRQEATTNWSLIVLVSSLVLLAIGFVVLLIGLLHHRKSHTAAWEHPAAIRILAVAADEHPSRRGAAQRSKRPPQEAAYSAAPRRLG
jgi:serine/threonine protein kinase